MKHLLFACTLAVTSILSANAQQNGAPLPLPVPTPAPVPNPSDANASKKEKEDVNAALVAARVATKEKRYADSEKLMLRATQDNPNFILPWIELGLAQLGLQKYDDAEKSFKIALGIDPLAVARAHNEDFYQQADAPGVVAPGATRASRNTAGGEVTNAQTRTPDVLGTSFASLGEIYIHQKEYAEAKTAFDSAVKDNPAQGAVYRYNETVFFFKAGEADRQLAAANQAIALDPARPAPYYFKAQALVSKATIDPATQKMVLPSGCAEAYQKYLQLDPNGPYVNDARGVLSAVGMSTKSK